MPRQRKPVEISKIAFCEKIAATLREFGYPDVTAEQVQECLDAWVTDKNGVGIPHGVIGMWVTRELEQVEEARPGAIALLK